MAAKAAPAARPGQVGRQPLRGGTPPQSKAKTSRLRRALLCSSPAPVAAQVLRGGPAPTSGGFGAVRPPAEPGPRLRAAAAALAPAGGRNLDRRAHWRRKRRLPRASRAAGRRERRLRAGVPAVAPAGKAKASPAQGGKPPTGGGLACQCPGQRLSCLSCWPGLVAGLPSWWCLWLVAVPVCPVALALCSGGGFCLSAGGGFSSRHLLACRCFCRSAGRRSLRVTAPPWVLSLAGGGPALGAIPCR